MEGTPAAGHDHCRRPHMRPDHSRHAGPYPSSIPSAEVAECPTLLSTTSLSALRNTLNQNVLHCLQKHEIALADNADSRHGDRLGWQPWSSPVTSKAAAHQRGVDVSAALHADVSSRCPGTAVLNLLAAFWQCAQGCCWAYMRQQEDCAAATGRDALLLCLPMVSACQTQCRSCLFVWSL